MEKHKVSIITVISITKREKRLWKSMWIKCAHSSQLWIPKTLLRFSTNIHKDDVRADVENVVSLFTAIN